MEEALLLGDVMSTGFYAAKQALIRGGEHCVVIGCGPVGLMAVLGGHHYDAGGVIAIDSIPERLQMAERFGATPLDLADPTLKAKVLEATGGRGADAVLEAVGSSSALQLAYDLVRPGGIISSVGVCNDKTFPITPVQAYDKNLTFRAGRCPARHMMDELIPVIQSKKYPVERILTHQMKLADGADAYDIFANRKENCLKVVLQP